MSIVLDAVAAQARERAGRIVVLGTGGTIAGRAQRPDELLA